MIPHIRPEMQACIDSCMDCHAMCIGSVSHHCLETGGEHVEKSHVRLLLACAEMCRATAAIMLMGVEQHKQVCRLCADICIACAQSCDKLDMQDCMRACRECAEDCRSMAA